MLALPWVPEIGLRALLQDDKQNGGYKVDIRLGPIFRK